MKRITADLDTKNKLEIIHSISKAIFYIEKIDSIELLRSNSKGFHLIVWTRKNYTQKEIYKLREKIGDDPHRIRLDKIRKVGRQTLFTKKIYKKSATKKEKKT